MRTRASFWLRSWSRSRPKHEGKLKVVKVNVDEDHDQARKLGAIRGIPTLVLYREGQVVSRLTGAQSLLKLEAMVAA